MKMIQEPDRGFSHKCYKKKADRRGDTVQIALTDEQWNQIKNWKKEPKKEVEEKKEVDCPHVTRWDPEWSYCAVGRRLSKKQLKQYCREKGKIWMNE